jgi:uncharacterized OsmC-like protein
MATVPRAKQINGVDIGELREYIESCVLEPTNADRHPEVIARWVGGKRAEVVSTLGGEPVYMGGDADPSAMNMLLRSLAACDIEVVVNTAALLGVEIEDLAIEASGYFNIQRYLGLSTELGPGYQRIGYTVRLKTRGASADQLEQIRQACIARSPVGDSLERNVPLAVEFEAS